MVYVSPQEMKRMALRTQLAEGEVIAFVQDAMRSGVLMSNYVQQPALNFGGGTNFCPNSDFSWSHLAATVPATDPADTSDDNKRVYRCFRQAVDADISSTGLRIAGAGSGEESTAYIPVWDKSYGVGVIGADDTANNYDIAFKFENNWLVPAKIWYVRVSCATVDNDPPPDGLKLFAGFWTQVSGDEGWVEESPFDLSVERLDIPDTTSGITYEYKVIASTDGGVEIGSTVLEVDDVGVLSPFNQLRITFYGASGYLEFKTYRRNKGTGETHLIDHQRNSTNLTAVDQGQSLKVEPSGFPTAENTNTRAYAEVAIEALPITQQKTFNDFTIRIPNFDTSAVLSEGTYLRIGLTSDVACAKDRQIMVDTIWASESYNTWAPNPNDGYGSLPSVSVTTGVGVGGSIPSRPAPVGSGITCVSQEHDLLLDLEDNKYTQLDKAIEGLPVYNGKGGNRIKYFIDGEVTQYYRIIFSHGLVLNCSESHRFIRSLEDGTGVQVRFLKKGDILFGLRKGVEIQVKVKKIELVIGKLKVRATKVEAGQGNLYYAVGDGSKEVYMYCHNLKAVEGDEF